MKIFIQLILLLIRGVAAVEKTKFSGQKFHNTFLFLSGRPSWSDYCLLISYWQGWLLWSPAWAGRKAFSWPFRAAGVRLSWCFLLWARLFRNLCCLCLLLLYVVLRKQNNNQALHWTHLWLLNAGIFSGSGTGLSWGWSSRICFDFSNCIYFCFFLLVLIMGSCRKCLPNKCRQSLLCSKIIVKDLPFLDALASLDFKLSVSGSVMFFS